MDSVATSFLEACINFEGRQEAEPAEQPEADVQRTALRMRLPLENPIQLMAETSEPESLSPQEGLFTNVSVGSRKLKYYMQRL